MMADKIWLLTDGGNPVSLHKGKDGIYREAITVKMVFLPERHVLNIADQNSIELICPYHFKGRTLNVLLLGVAIGIVTGGMTSVEPILSAIVILTFALTTLLFHTNSTSEYVLLRTVNNENVKFFIMAEEELDNLKMAFSDKFIDKTKPGATDLNDNDKRIVDTLRLSIVTTSSSITSFVMLPFVRQTIEGQDLSIQGLLSCIIFMIAIVMASVGAYGVVKSYTLRLEGKNISQKTQS